MITTMTFAYEIPCSPTLIYSRMVSDLQAVACPLFPGTPMTLSTDTTTLDPALRKVTRTFVFATVQPAFGEQVGAGDPAVFFKGLFTLRFKNILQCGEIKETITPA